MKKRKTLPGLTTLILFIALTGFFSCKTAPEPTPTPAAVAQAAIAILAPPLPATPEMEPVRFEDRGDGGLWLSYNDYRALERNVIAMREYSARLEIIIKFYREEYR